MRSIPRALVLLLAVLALGVVAASAQAATEGPFYKVSGTRLASGSTKGLTVTAKENFLLESATLGVGMTCTGVNRLAGAKIVGSSGTNSSTSEMTLEFTGCSIDFGGGSGCQVEQGKFTTTLLKGTLGYATASRTGQLEMLLKPASGTTIATIHFTGAGCTRSSATVAGKTVLLLRSGNSPIEVGVNEVQATTNELQFKRTNATKIWTESAGALTEAKASLTLEGLGFTVGGTLKTELESLPEWGFFT